MNLRDNLNVLGKIQKSALFYWNYFRSNRKRRKKNDKDGNESAAIIFYKIKFIDNARFKATSLSNLVDNLTEGIHKFKCKY